MAVIPAAILRLHTINGAPDNNHIMAGRIFYTQAGGQITTTDSKRTKEKTEEAGNRSEQWKRFSRTSNL